MAETTELDTTQEETPPSNGHNWQSFDDDQAMLRHILSQKPAEQIVEVPEWQVKILCKALPIKVRTEIQAVSFDQKLNTYNYRPALPQIVIAGCYNPTTGKRIFNDSHKLALLQEQDGSPVERLAITILRLSQLLASNIENIKKN